MPPDPDAQVQLALDNMKQTLAAAGWTSVTSCSSIRTYGQGIATDERHLREAFRVRQHAGARDDSRTSLPGGNTIEFTGVAVTDLSKRLAVRPKNMSPSATASPCVFADDTYYCSAKGPFTPGPRNLQGIWVATVETQVRQTMRNLLDGLEEAGLGLANVVATNVYLDDINDFARMNRIYAQYFAEMPPARTTLAQIAPVDRTPRKRTLSRAGTDFA